MEQIKQLATDLETLQSGDCWIGYNALQILDGIDIKMAMHKAYERGNSIWQIVNHISYWRAIVTMRITERRALEEDRTGFDLPEIISADEWEKSKQKFYEAYEILKNAISNFDETILHQPIRENESYYYHIAGSLQHDAFHLGQIMLLKRAFEEKTLSQII